MDDILDKQESPHTNTQNNPVETPSNGNPGPQVVLDGYNYIKYLGKGGFGVVHLMEHQRTRQERAVKVLTRELDPESIKRFAREALVGAALDHPNLVRVHDVGRDGLSRECLIMDYVAGPTLDKYRVEDLTTALDIASQTAVALAYLHSKDLTHRDLKPQNIFVMEERDILAASEDPDATKLRVRVGDFGLVKPMKAGSGSGEEDETLTQQGHFIGSWLYASPEHLSSTRDVTEQTDLYSLGVILYQLLTDGSFPPGYEEARSMRSQNRLEALSMMHRAKLKLPPKPSTLNPAWHIPEPLDELVLKLLQPDAKDRFQTAAEVFSALEDVRSRITPPGPLLHGLHVRFSDVQKARNREGLRLLFKALGYTTLTEQFDVAAASFPKVIAENVISGYALARYQNPTTRESFQIILFELRDVSTASIRSLAEHMVRRGGDYLLVVAKPTHNVAGAPVYEQPTLVYPARIVAGSSGPALVTKIPLKIHRFALSTTRPTRYMLDVLERIALPAGVQDIKPVDIIARLLEAFNVEAVGNRFYRQYATLYHRIVDAALAANPSERAFVHRAEVEGFVQRMLGRIMFLYFVQKKQWLTRDLAFLTTQYNLAKKQNANYYTSVLLPLFFDTLAVPETRRKAGSNGTRAWTEAEVPYLNGGLFELQTGHEYERTLQLDNSLFDPEVADSILRFFNSYDFTVEEDTPLNVQVAVDPEMLGKTFEELITSRHATGSYYTPKPIVSFMCREALKGYLSAKLPGKSAEDIAKLVDEHNKSNLRHGDRLHALNALASVKVTDPACGSGAYLLGMLHELLDLWTLLLAEESSDADSTYNNKLEIISNNLYGVDVDPFAVNIARLRLWLSLIVDFNGSKPLPLPNLDFKIEQGDSLTGPNPTALQPDMFRTQLIQEMLILKRRYMSAHGGEKYTLREEIDEKRKELIQHRGSSAGSGFDWQVEFAEIFEDGGFDIIVANPPYGATVAENVRDLYFDRRTEAAQSKDTYGLFMARALQLLRPKGQFTFIVSDTWRTIKSHRPLRRRLLTQTSVSHVLDLPSWIFGATVNTCILTLTNSKPSPEHTLIAGDLRNIPRGDWKSLTENLLAVAVHGADAQNERYARYTYPQDLISTYENLSFFIGSPRLYALLSDKRFKRIGDVADVKVGLQTGDNEFYLRKRVGAHGSYQILDESKLLAESELAALTDAEKRNGVDPAKYQGRHFVPYDKGGVSDAVEGWLPNYYVPTQYFIDWSTTAISRLRNSTVADIKRRKGQVSSIRPADETTRAAVIRNPDYYFREGITFSDSGIYSPTFRRNAHSAFDQKGSVIIPTADISRDTLLALLCSTWARYVYKVFINHTVSSHVDSIKEFPCLASSPKYADLASLVDSTVKKQKQNNRYSYHLHEQRKIDAIVAELYGLDGEAIRGIKTWYYRRYPSLARAQNWQLNDRFDIPSRTRPVRRIVRS